MLACGRLSPPADIILGRVWIHSLLHKVLVSPRFTDTTWYHPTGHTIPTPSSVKKRRLGTPACFKTPNNNNPFMWHAAAGHVSGTGLFICKNLKMQRYPLLVFFSTKGGEDLWKKCVQSPTPLGALYTIYIIYPPSAPVNRWPRLCHPLSSGPIVSEDRQWDPLWLYYWGPHTHTNQTTQKSQSGVWPCAVKYPNRGVPPTCIVTLTLLILCTLVWHDLGVTRLPSPLTSACMESGG